MIQRLKFNFEKLTKSVFIIVWQYWIRIQNAPESNLVLLSERPAIPKNVMRIYQQILE